MSKGCQERLIKVRQKRLNGSLTRYVLDKCDIAEMIHNERTDKKSVHSIISFPLTLLGTIIEMGSIKPFRVTSL